MALLRDALREPLLAFFLVGALLFGLDRARPVADDARAIQLDDAFVAGLAAESARRTGHVPDAQETDALAAAWVREEVLYREARRLGLDEGDLIVRRRLVQKMELLLAAEARWAPPTQAELGEYLRAHAEDFRRPTRTSLSLCFFARESGEATERAVNALGHPEAMRCDPHLPGDHFQARTAAQLSATLGENLTRAVSVAAVGAWTGPIETSRGVYLLRVEAREAEHDATLDEVGADVLRALEATRRAESLRESERALATRYPVERSR